MATNELKRPRIGWVEERHWLKWHKGYFSETPLHYRAHHGTKPLLIEYLFL
jgi:hypothetical protein